MKDVVLLFDVVSAPRFNLVIGGDDLHEHQLFVGIKLGVDRTRGDLQRRPMFGRPTRLSVAASSALCAVTTIAAESTVTAAFTWTTRRSVGTVPASPTILAGRGRRFSVGAFFPGATAVGVTSVFSIEARVYVTTSRGRS